MIGCVTPFKSSNYASHQTVEDNIFHYEIIVENYEDIEMASGVAAYKAEAMSIETGERYFRSYFTAPTIVNSYVVSTYDNQINAACENLFKTKCVITRSTSLNELGEVVYWHSLTEYKLAQAAKEKTEAEYKENRLALEQEEKQRLIASLTKRCKDYGFSGDSNIAACIQREAQHDKELEMQKWELEKTRVALQQAQSKSYIQESSVEDEVPPLLKILGAIAEGYAEGYQQAQTINSLDSRYEKKSIYSNCKPNC